jgi:hypothetical protein
MVLLCLLSARLDVDVFVLASPVYMYDTSRLRETLMMVGDYILGI